MLYTIDYPPAAREIPILRLRPTGMGDFTHHTDVQLLAWLIRQTDGNIVEIGCHNGATTLRLAAAFPGRTIHALDTYDIDPAHPQASEHAAITSIGHLAAIASNVIIHRQPSATLDYTQLTNPAIVFIDGSHLYADALRDTLLAMDCPTMRLIIWHDYCHHLPWLGVGRLIDELAQTRDIIHVRGTSICYLTSAL